MTKPVADYLEYHRNNAKMWEIDTHLDAAVWFADRNKLDLEQRYWLCFLTAICETTPTSLYLFHHFPSIEEARPVELKAFCDANRGAMAFQYDVRWMLYWIDEVLESYQRFVGLKTQECALRSVAVGSTGEERFNSLTANMRVKSFGNYVFMLYTELVHYLCGIDLEAVISPADNHSVRSGLISACGYQDIISCTKKGSKPTQAECELLSIELNEIYQRIQQLPILRRHKRMWSVETTLCTYNKTLHGKRYLGFYRNRQAKEIKRLSDYTRSIGESFDWKPLMEYHDNWGNWNNRYL